MGPIITRWRLELSMAPRMKTRERIVQSSLELFNQQGERCVSTNHIAAHMEISPGNLYYHFPNKQAIIAVLFNQYEELVDSFLRPPQGRSATVEDKRFYLKALLAAMWNYRFLHRDLEHLLDSDPELAARYRRFSQRCLQQGQAIYRGFVEAGILNMDAAQLESLTINAWIVLTSWVRFLSTTREHSAHLGEEAFKRGVYQVVVLELGYVTPAARAAVQALCAEFHVPFNQALEQ
ncbi:TetR/AcrR family transcriptional regulator [Pseudomonas sp. BJa3]|jgi:AcrR family transcriptional regulator|uniref:Transcriptional regulator, TetR family n=3 Tax=Pseudomonas soli TaxID=1306993 RepID=A0A1H9IBA3_9PSED|nr:TetR/AcrR family transcriptional regulator [Pseudomonas sp. BJa3]SEQ71818.1 transcriptional regulator, TetR family [Pseudomonas soli]